MMADDQRRKQKKVHKRETRGHELRRTYENGTRGQSGRYEILTLGARGSDVSARSDGEPSDKDFKAREREHVKQIAVTPENANPMGCANVSAFRSLTL